ncbi:hypothetical protein INT47_006536 [Mucor saturninus]|uniref:Uncharacterized protein n=1 Tax=Mucor saturninus TaxID=64648 RepID=A0A8H7V0J0_9FUNG|nr:hypothetical protein INT47_006536 [Mucor saturninus]
MSHPHSSLQIYQLLSNIHQACGDNEQQFEAILISLQGPRFKPLSVIYEHWVKTFEKLMPQLLDDFRQLLASAQRSPEYDTLLMHVADHYALIYRVSCFLETDMELELFVRCLCLDSSTPVNIQEVKQTLLQFLAALSPDTRDFVQEILVDDHHGYLSREDCMMEESLDHTAFQGFLDLDRVYAIVNDPNLFEHLMAIIQANATRNVSWSQTVQEIYALVAERGIWEQLSPLLQQMHMKQENEEYDSYEDFVKKNFLDDGGQEYLDGEIERAQVEHMFSNLKM